MTPDQRHQAALTEARDAQHVAWRRGHWLTARADAGRIRILNRHQPYNGNHGWLCDYCAHDWPCPDWTDAAAQPEETNP